MSYLDWSVGGLVPSWIANVKWGFGGASSGSGSSAGRADSTVTLIVRPPPVTRLKLSGL